MPQQILSHEFDNGFALVAEPMPWLESAAFCLLVPAGCSRDPDRLLGLSNFTSEMVQRGCGNRDSRAFVEDLELLGVDGSATVSVAHSSFSSAMPAESLLDAIAIYADVVRRPHLPEEQLEDGRQVCIQEIRAVEDDLAQRTMMRLRERHYPAPWGRSSQGTLESVKQIARRDIQSFFETHYRPGGAILSVAGKVDWGPLLAHVANCFADWQSAPAADICEEQEAGGYENLDHASSQTHIGVAFPSVPYSHPDYFQARGAVGVLSDGMSSRLFTEVREKRGLCYSVHASCHSLRNRGSVTCYAGTTTERAQETLDVMVAELERLVDGVHPQELDRLKSKIKSSLIMQQESSISRSGSIAGDWYHLKRARTMAELTNILDKLTSDSINLYLRENPPREFTVVTLGEKPLEMPRGVS